MIALEQLSAQAGRFALHNVSVTIERGTWRGGEGRDLLDLVVAVRA